MSDEDNNYKIHITEALSSKKIMELINENPELKLITCSKSLYDRIPEKYLNALEQLDINVEIEYKQGAKPKFSKELIDNVIELKNNGYKAAEISDEVNIKTKQVYYIIEKYSDIKLKGYKSKYPDELKEKIRQMKKDGLKVQNISEETGIPIRSIYYILNKK
ncbi:hypothetical protein [Methanobrevibacter boviskoreani]|uniref:hypothetical protein n=1 Tax=Methanobrevibacter boviskoreani TaxID=1348249 RepID=UPI000593895F|nr:hypothetical protein [Methanobrevibacter boviskoreani]